MQISDSFKKRTGKGTDAYELFVAFLFDKFIHPDLIVGNRTRGLPDCYTSNLEIGFEITRVGYQYDFERESIVFGFTNSTIKYLEKAFENETLRNTTNYRHIIDDKFKKLNSGNYNQIKNGCHLVVYDLDRLESKERIDKLIKIFEYFSNKNQIKFLSLFLVTTSSIKNYFSSELKTVVEYSTNEFNNLVRQFKNLYNIL